MVRAALTGYRFHLQTCPVTVVFMLFQAGVRDTDPRFNQFVLPAKTTWLDM